MTRQDRVQRWAITFLAIFTLTVLALAIAQRAEAQTVTAEATVTWELPTTDTLGGPLTGANALTKVQLYVSTSPITENTTITPIDLPPVAQSFAYEQDVPNGSTLYFRLRACIEICGPLSEATAQSQKEVRVSVPNVPTGVTVTLRVNLSVE